MMSEKLIKELESLGLAKLEANVYVVLLSEAGLTGYRIANRLNKPNANTYKALDSLTEKGLVVSTEHGHARRYSPVPINEYLNRRELDFKSQRKRIEASIDAMEHPRQEEGLFSLKQYNQALAKARSMIASAESIVVSDMYPAIFNYFKEDLMEAVARGVEVFLILYDDQPAEGCTIIKPGPDDTTLDHWDNDWLMLSIDASNFLMAFLRMKEENNIQTIWGNSPYIAATFFSDLCYEMMLRHVMNHVKAGADNATIEQKYTQLRDQLFLQSGAMQQFQKLINREPRPAT